MRCGGGWEGGASGLLVGAVIGALADDGSGRRGIEAAWVGNALDDINVGNSALPAAHALRLDKVPVTRVENMCATGTEALRGSGYSVASGRGAVVLAVGVTAERRGSGWERGMVCLEFRGESSGTMVALRLSLPILLVLRVHTPFVPTGLYLSVSG